MVACNWITTFNSSLRRKVIVPLRYPICKIKISDLDANLAMFSRLIKLAEHILLNSPYNLLSLFFLVFRLRTKRLPVFDKFGFLHP